LKNSYSKKQLKNKYNKMISSPKVIELFAGAGGLALGLENAGFESLGLIEFDKSASLTLRKNRPNWNVIHEDVAKISPLDLEELFSTKKGDLDLLSGGAPCQSFSYAGKRLGLEDARGTLFYHYAVFLQKLQPKMFLFENVDGLLTHDGGKTFITIKKVFSDCGYTIRWKVLNANDFGVPQKRKRLITVGVRQDLADQIKFSFPPPHTYKPVLRDILSEVPESEGTKYSEDKQKIFDLVPPGGCWKHIDPEVAKKYMKSCWDMEGGRTGILRRMSLDEPSLTVLTSPGQKQTDRCHPLESRPFTVRENARCQSFPDEWVFEGSMGEKYKQVGNAVPVGLAYEIGLSIKRALENKKEKNMDWNLSFIAETELKEHVMETIRSYGNKLESYNLEKFNRNIVDPVKMLFDSNVYRSSWKEIVKNEIFRQRDKSNSNDISYFHQNIFKYIPNCEVPGSGWDVIFESTQGIDIGGGNIVHKIYVELKNKHNTMNSSSAAKTFIKMQTQLLQDDDCACFLVEAIAKHSQNISWSPTVDGTKNHAHQRIRRVSLDNFYEIVTGDSDAFYKLCMALPDVISACVLNEAISDVPNDTVYDEIMDIAYREDGEFATALFLLGFGSYKGFASTDLRD
jgi:DNA (cytosine-5)-methyltransferase 1